MEIHEEDVIRRIQELTEFKGWSRYRLIKEANLSPTTVANIFKRGTCPSIITLKSICNAFGISLSEFFYFQENPLRDFSMEEDEQELVNKYRTLSKANKKILQAYLQGLCDVVNSNDKKKE